MLRLADDRLLFGGVKSQKLLQWGSFTAQHLSDIERSATPLWLHIESSDVRS